MHLYRFKYVALLFVGLLPLSVFAQVATPEIKKLQNRVMVYEQRPTSISIRPTLYLDWEGQFAQSIAAWFEARQVSVEVTSEYLPPDTLVLEFWYWDDFMLSDVKMRLTHNGKTVGFAEYHTSRQARLSRQEAIDRLLRDIFTNL